MAETAVFVDFDGTVTDVDTFALLGRAAVGDARWDEIDRALDAGRITLRDALREQAAALRLSRVDALAFLEANATVDPTFPAFVDAVRERGWSMCVVSCGITPLIEHALTCAGVTLPVFATEVDFAPTGWTMTFPDDSTNGHDKAKHVRAARDAGAWTVYAGDGISDVEAIRLADRRFVKRGSSLEAYCRAHDLACEPFGSFAEIGAALFD